MTESTVTAIYCTLGFAAAIGVGLSLGKGLRKVSDLIDWIRGL